MSDTLNYWISFRDPGIRPLCLHIRPSLGIAQPLPLPTPCKLQQWFWPPSSWTSVRTHRPAAVSASHAAAPASTALSPVPPDLVASIHRDRALRVGSSSPSRTTHLSEHLQAVEPVLLVSHAPAPASIKTSPVSVLWTHPVRHARSRPTSESCPTQCPL